MLCEMQLCIPQAVRSGKVAAPRPKVGEMRAALFKSTGIDSTQSNDGDLFNLMVRHYDGKPPAAAFGVSAKFYSDGRKQTARYHIGLRLPCSTVSADGNGDAGARLAASGHAAAVTLSAPPLVHAWVDAIGDAPVGMGFGLAHLDDAGNKGGKIYVMNLAGQPMPKLPLSVATNGVAKGAATIYDSIPALQPKRDGAGVRRDWLDSHMVSLEWLIGDNRVVLRHYSAQLGGTHEQRIRSSGSQACVCV